MATTDGKPLKSRLIEFLFSYRNTPHTTSGKSPAQMMFGRQLNCVLSNIRPNKSRALQFEQVKANIMAQTPEYQPGDKVFIKTKLEKKWKPAEVKTRKHVVQSDGRLQRKHAEQMRSRIAVIGDNPPKSSPTQLNQNSSSTPSTAGTVPASTPAGTPPTSTN